jgi:hypothetical protein
MSKWLIVNDEYVANGTFTEMNILEHGYAEQGLDTEIKTEKKISDLEEKKTELLAELAGIEKELTAYTEIKSQAQIEWEHDLTKIISKTEPCIEDWDNREIKSVEVEQEKKEDERWLIVNNEYVSRGSFKEISEQAKELRDEHSDVAFDLEYRYVKKFEDVIQKKADLLAQLANIQKELNAHSLLKRQKMKKEGLKRKSLNYSIILPDEDLELLQEIAAGYDLTWSGKGSISKLLKAICRGEITLKKKSVTYKVIKTGR